MPINISIKSVNKYNQAFGLNQINTNACIKNNDFDDI